MTVQTLTARPSRTATCPPSSCAASASRTATPTVVRDLDLDIGAGEFFSMLGPSGCGKTTTLRMIGGFVDPTDGDGAAARRGRHRPAAQPARRQHRLPELRALRPPLDLGQRRVRAAAPQGRQGRDAAARRRDARAGAAHRPRQGQSRGALSGGQRQRVALARALVNRPSVLLLDEPLAALDLKLRRAMQVELKRIQREVGITFVFVTHDQDEALTMSDRIAVMSEGTHPPGRHARGHLRAAGDARSSPGFIGTANLMTGEYRDGAVALRRRHGAADRPPRRLRAR